MSELLQQLNRLPIVNRESFLLGSARGESVLHLGCVDAPYLQSRLDEGDLLHAHLAGVTSDLVGIDNDKAGVEFLEKLGFQDVLLGDLEALKDLELNRTFSIVMAGEVLEHLPNPGLCLVELRNLLEEGGYLIVSVPNAFSIKVFMRMVGGKESVHPDHVSYYSARTLQTLLAKCGYSITWAGYYVASSKSGFKRAVDKVALDPIRFFAPSLSDGLIVKAKVIE